MIFNRNNTSDRKFNVVSSDYGSFMIAATCRDGAEDQDSKWDYVAMTRDKAPSKFMRQKMRSILKA